MKIAMFIVGFGLGLGAYRLFLEYTAENISLSVCDICQWKVKKMEAKRNRQRPQ